MTVLILSGAFCFGMLCLLYAMYWFTEAVIRGIDELDDKDWMK